MEKTKSAPHSSSAAAIHIADAAVHIADAAVHIVDAAVHAADSAQSASAATRCDAAAVAAVARDACPASTEPEEDTGIDVELGRVGSSSSSSSTPSSPSSSLSTSTLQNLKDMLEWFDSWSGIISEVFLTASMGVPVYPSYKRIRKSQDPNYMLFFIPYCSAWIFINTILVFIFLGRSKKENRISLWIYRLYMMGIFLLMVLFIYFLIPHTSAVNLGDMTAWNLRLTYDKKILKVLMVPWTVMMKLLLGWHQKLK